MRIYVGSTRSREFISALHERDIGRVNTPGSRFKPYPEEKWLADNGAYSLWLKGSPFREAPFLRYLEVLAGFSPQPQFAVLPDIVADGLRSLEYSIHWASRGDLPSWPWYLALQDGMSVADVESCIDIIDGLFIGGTLRFKSEVYTWVELGRRHNKPIHFGRAGVHHRLHEAHRAGCDSADSAFPLWCRERFFRFLEWVEEGHYKPTSYRQILLEFRHPRPDNTHP